MKSIWRQLILPHIDYCSQLYQPTGGGELQKLEELQRHFSSRVFGPKLDYWERLKFLNISSIQRRFERYRIIYVWKVFEGIVPNCGINETYINRLGCKCNIPSLNRSAPARIRTIRESSFQIHGGRLFNSLPQYLRDKTSRSVEEFKESLDAFLSKIPDQPNVQGTEYTPRACDIFSGRPSNSLTDQIRTFTEQNNQLIACRRKHGL